MEPFKGGQVELGEGCPNGPLVQIMPVENGYLITAYNGPPKQTGAQDISGMMGSIMNAMQDGKDPAEAFKRSIDQMSLKEAVRRKAVEHHVSKNVDETLKLVGEILGAMKG